MPQCPCTIKKSRHVAKNSHSACTLGHTRSLEFSITAPKETYDEEKAWSNAAREQHDMFSTWPDNPFQYSACTNCKTVLLLRRKHLPLEPDICTSEGSYPQLGNND